MTSAHPTRQTPGAGSVKNSNVRGMRRIVVAFDDETFGQVYGIAVKRRVSFANVVRELVEFGLMDVGDLAKGSEL